MTILIFVAVLVAVLAVMFLPRRSKDTFTSDEMAAFRRAEQVKKDLGDVQKLVGPAKAPFTISIGGANIPAPPEQKKD